MKLQHHLAFYNGKAVIVQDDDKKAEFRRAAMRIVDNAKDGHVITPKGIVYQVSREFRRARRLPSCDGACILAEASRLLEVLT